MNQLNIDKYVSQIERAVLNANIGETKLPDTVFSISGMSTKKTRIFLNTLLELPDSKYLEIGIWKGSTFVSAMFNNSPSYAVCLDDFSQFVPGKPGYEAGHGNPAKDLADNLKLISAKYEFFNSEAFSFNKGQLEKKFNVYFYDGRHDFDDQRLALTYYLDTLDEEFIFICDDWNFPQVKVGTYEGLRQTGIKVHRSWELPANFNGDTENWWNGLFVAVCSKA